MFSSVCLCSYSISMFISLESDVYNTTQGEESRCFLIDLRVQYGLKYPEQTK